MRYEKKKSSVVVAAALKPKGKRCLNMAAHKLPYYQDHVKGKEDY